jgi:uncharacterized membrane protein (UPF0127 family)
MPPTNAPVQTLRNTSRPAPPLQVQNCSTFACRLRGLTFRRSLPPDWGLLLIQAQENRLDAAIHMLGMLVDLGIIWIDAGMNVVDVRHARRWLSFIIPRQPAKFVLETHVEQIAHYHIGDCLTLE